MTQQVVDTTKVPTIEPALQSLGQFYTFRRPEEVSRFLEAHPFLIPLLLEAHSKIMQYFAPSPDVILEVVTDPEATDYRDLFAYVGTRLPPDEAFARLDRLDKDWWLDAMDRAQGNLCIDVEFL